MIDGFQSDLSIDIDQKMFKTQTEILLSENENLTLQLIPRRFRLWWQFSEEASLLISFW